ncbi:hypothetical protein HBB16_06305 [Pseudonocardia sp. MCCB 268]|nr:hypothetical protein [Pseudonocardia cytotoxica]
MVVRVAGRVPTRIDLQNAGTLSSSSDSRLVPSWSTSAVTSLRGSSAQDGRRLRQLSSLTPFLVGRRAGSW